MTEKILFWNCCGGLTSKIDTIRQIINKFQPLLMFISESEILQSHDTNWFGIQNYELTLSHTIKLGKSRIVCYNRCNSGVKIRLDLIKKDCVEVIPVDFDGIRIVGVYRPFKLIANQTNETAC